MKSLCKILLTALFLVPLFSFAQSNYKPGYVVTLKGDTLKGFINYREWQSNPEYIDFKSSIADNMTKKFTAADIGYFEINGLESYLRYAGPISMDATDKDHLSSIRDTSYRPATVFFKVLQKGSNLALYSYNDDLKMRFYIGEAPNFSIKELGYKIYYNNSDNDVSGQKGATVNENTYMKQLFALANKYEVLNDGFQWDIEHTGYNADDMLKIVSRINHISKADFKKIGAGKGPIFNLFIGAGVNINNFSSPANSAYSTSGGISYTSSSPEVSFGANFFANPSTRQLQFRIEIGVSKSQFKALYPLKVYPYIPFKASFDETEFYVTPQVIYNFYNAENFKIYGGVGVSLGFINYSNSYLGSQSQPNSATDIQANDPYFFLNTADAFIIKAGVQIHKNWGIFAQYASSVDVTNGGYFQLSSTCEQIGVNYYFR